MFIDQLSRTLEQEQRNKKVQAKKHQAFLASSMNPALTFAEAERRAYMEGNTELAFLFGLLPDYLRARNATAEE